MMPAAPRRDFPCGGVGPDACSRSNLATVRPARARDGNKGNETVLGKSCNLQPRLAAVILVGFFDVDVWTLVDICEVVLMLVLLQPRLGPD